MPNDYIIRAAQATDLAALPAIERAAGALFPSERIPIPNKTIPRAALEQAARESLLFVALENNEPVGFACAIQQGDFLYLQEVSVHPNYSKKGIGRALVTTVLTKSVAMMLTGVTLTTFSDFKWNAPFYRSLGFSELDIGTAPEHIQRNLDDEAKQGLINRVGMLAVNRSSDIQKISFQTTTDAPELASKLRSLFLDEWDALDPFEGNHSNVSVPTPIIATDRDDRLIGGLAFSTFKHPINEHIAVWINAVLVIPNYRGKGVAKELIRRAEQAAIDLGIVELCVLTEYPSLYAALDWVPVSHHNADTVLAKTL